MPLDGLRAPIRSSPLTTRGSQYGDRVGSMAGVGWSSEWQRYFTQLDLLLAKWSLAAIGVGAEVSSINAVGVGRDVRVSQSATGVGHRANAGGVSSISIGNATSAGGTAGVTVGGTAGGDYGIGLGISSAAGHNYTFVVGRGAESTQTNEAIFGDGTNSYYRNWLTRVQGNGQAFALRSLTELTTITAAAITDTAIQIPAGAILLSANVRVTVVIPTAATFTVTGATSGTAFNTAAISTAANTTDDGTVAGAFYNGTAQSVRITPNLTPADNTGRVRVTLIYFEAIPATS